MILTLLLDFCLVLNTCCVYVTRFVEILAYVLIFSGLDEIVANDVLLLSESLTCYKVSYYILFSFEN